MSARNWMVIIALGILSLQTFAVDVFTSIRNISHEANNQLLGSFTLKIDNNAFSNASNDNPIYIRFKLSSANGWSRTLVDLRSDAHDSVRRPINLAIYPSGNHALNPGLPADSVQLVRLIAGEDAGWIRINQSSDTWIQQDLGLAPPSQDLAVSFTIGVTGDNSVRPGANTASGGNEASDSGYLVGTLLRADYERTPSFQIGDLERLSFVSFDSSTSGVETGNGTRPGSDAGVGFSNDPFVARGDGIIPCFEYHFKADDFDAPTPRARFNRMNALWRDENCARVEPLFFSNSSDFEWHPGSRLFLTATDFNPDYRVTGVSPPALPPEQGKVNLVESEATVASNDGAVWKVEKLFVDDVFAGFDLTLVSGIFPIWGVIELENVRVCTGGWFDGRSLTLKAGAWFVHPNISRNEPERIASIFKKTVIVEKGEEDYQRRILPFTGFDRDDWNTHIQIVNLSDQAQTFTAFLYQEQGIHVGNFGLEKLKPYEAKTLDLSSLFGADFAKIFRWMEILSEGPVIVVGSVESVDAQTFDIFTSVDESRRFLYGPHIPANDLLWEAKAYVISSEFETESSSDLVLAEESRALPLMNFPRRSIVLEDSDFTTNQNRSSWFRVDSTEQAASGLFFFERRDNRSQLASISLNEQPSNTWSFDHLGNPENGWWNGLILFNPLPSPTTATLAALNARGEQLLQVTLQLFGNSRLVDVVGNLIPASEPIDRLTIETETPVVAGMLMGRQDEEILTHVPGSVPEGKEFILPYVSTGEDRWTGLAITNIRFIDNGITVTPYLPGGEPGLPLSYTVGPKQKEIILLDNLQPGATHLKIESESEIRVFGLSGAPGRLATIPISEPVNQ